MKALLAPIAAALLVTLAACDAPVTDYTNAESPNNLTLHDVSHSLVVHFAPGSDRLARGEAQRLGRLVATGEIGAHDRISVSPAGPPALAARRVTTLASEMLRYGLTIGEVPLAVVPRDSAIVDIGRYLLTTPPCPNWSGPASSDFGNVHYSNFGCSTATNLGQMVASPADIASGQPLGLAAGQPAAAAVNRYNTDKVVLPTPNSALPIAAPASAAPGGSSPGS
ncbi:MAG TPA: CpaD family pilus assembly lipoprotein [Stellaceae bacterium]|jgi:pilus assembly protein CpaD